MTTSLQSMTSPDPSSKLTAGQTIISTSGSTFTVESQLAEAFQPGDRLLVAGNPQELLHLPGNEVEIAQRAVSRAQNAFTELNSVTDLDITHFFQAFSDRLANDDAFALISKANDSDLERATRRGRSTTRLALTQKMRSDMIAGLNSWAESKSSRGRVIETITHDGFDVELVNSPLGVVGFVFEGRPNVFADACGVLRSGNTVVFRIGSDALETAKAIRDHALTPALERAGLPHGSVSLIESASHAAGWAMFADSRLSLAVARGSGRAVAQLGDIARQAGTPVSLHGTGGAWIIASPNADKRRLGLAVQNSLDRKVCNTVNTVCIARSAAQEQISVVLDALSQAALNLGANPKLHVLERDRGVIPDGWFRQIEISRATGNQAETQCSVHTDQSDLAIEWEWERSPELTVVVVDSITEAVELFNRYSPKFAASLISESADEQATFFTRIDSPFVGNGFTRWVDGQYALDKPELGLSNWEGGRLFGRGGVLSGDSVFTVRTRVTQRDVNLRR